MPKNNQKATVRTLLFVLISVLLINGVWGKDGSIVKMGGLKTTLPHVVKEAITWILPD